MDKIKDTKIPTKEKNIGYGGSANRASEKLKDVQFVDEVDYQNDYEKWFNYHYEHFVNWYNESEARSELKKCPQCTSPLKVVPAGVSKKNGNRYEAFYACDSCGYKKSVVEKKVDNETNLPAEERVVETPMPPKQ